MSFGRTDTNGEVLLLQDQHVEIFVRFCLSKEGCLLLGPCSYYVSANQCTWWVHRFLSC